MNHAVRELAKSEVLDFIQRYGLNKVDGEMPDVWPKHVAATIKVWVGMVEGELVCMWGIIPPTLLSDKCYLWLSTTDGLKGNEFRFTRHSQRVIEIILDEYKEIIGDVKVGADRSVRWLKWLGAELGDVNGDLISFTIRKKNG